MTTRIPIAAALVLLAGPVLAQSLGEKTGVNSVLGIAPKTADFAMEVANSDRFEIGSSELAATRATDEPTKMYAKQMVAEHAKTSEELKAMVTGGKVTVTLPTALDSSHQKMMDKLQGLNGEDFTKQYRSDQVSAHKDAVNLFKRYADGGDNPDLKAWAAKTLPALEGHLKMAQDLDK